jgi:hypothetical protein
METIFFDYYHPYAGLCNQLYLITNHIHRSLQLDKKIFINKFNIDIFKKNRVPFNEVIDITRTNKNLKLLTGREIIDVNPPDLIKYIPKLCIYPVSSIEILNCLEFNEKILKEAEIIKRYNCYENFDNYYGIHFRLEIDCILHYTYPKKVYNQFMDLVNNDPKAAIVYFDLLDKQPIKDYCKFLMQQYLVLVQQFGFDKPWYISTGLMKYRINDYFIVYLKQLVDFILINGGSYYLSDTIYDDRELNALVDLLILRDCEKLIGFEGSSFSEGYCYKVNQIRKVTKEFLFVKEKNDFGV